MLVLDNGAHGFYGPVHERISLEYLNEVYYGYLDLLSLPAPTQCLHQLENTLPTLNKSHADHGKCEFPDVQPSIPVLVPDLEELLRELDILLSEGETLQVFSVSVRFHPLLGQTDEGSEKGRWDT